MEVSQVSVENRYEAIYTYSINYFWLYPPYNFKTSLGGQLLSIVLMP